MRWDDTVMCVTLMSSIAATGQTTSATDGFHRHLTRAHALPSQVITHTTTVDATIIPSPAQGILEEDSVTTGITTAGREVSVTRPTVTFTAPGDVTYLTITALASLRLSVNVTSTRPGRMTAVHANYWMVSYTTAHATTNPETARGLCSSPVMASATKIRLQQERQLTAIACSQKLSTMKSVTYVISRLQRARWDIMSTASVILIDQHYTRLPRAKTLADTTPMAGAIITRATVRIDIIPLTVNAIVRPAGIPPQRV